MRCIKKKDIPASLIGAAVGARVATLGYAAADTASLHLLPHLGGGALTGSLLTWMYRNT